MGIIDHRFIVLHLVFLICYFIWLMKKHKQRPNFNINIILAGHLLALFLVSMTRSTYFATFVPEDVSSRVGVAFIALSLCVLYLEIFSARVQAFLADDITKKKASIIKKLPALVFVSFFTFSNLINTAWILRIELILFFTLIPYLFKQKAQNLILRTYMNLVIFFSIFALVWEYQKESDFNILVANLVLLGGIAFIYIFLKVRMDEAKSN